MNLPVVSASASEETTLRIVLHVVRIGPLRLVDGRLGLSRGQSLYFSFYCVPFKVEFLSSDICTHIILYLILSVSDTKKYVCVAFVYLKKKGI